MLVTVLLSYTMYSLTRSKTVLLIGRKLIIKCMIGVAVLLFRFEFNKL